MLAGGMSIYELSGRLGPEVPKRRLTDTLTLSRTTKYGTAGDNAK